MLWTSSEENGAPVSGSFGAKTPCQDQQQSNYKSCIHCHLDHFDDDDNDDYDYDDKNNDDDNDMIYRQVEVNELTGIF